MTAAGKDSSKTVKVVDEVAVIRCVTGDGLVREEVWEDASGQVVRFNLAFINHRLFAGDNGRVLGYDNAHGAAHRHFAGKVETIAQEPCRARLDRFLDELDRLRKLESI